MRRIRTTALLVAAWGFAIWFDLFGPGISVQVAMGFLSEYSDYSNETTTIDPVKIVITLATLVYSLWLVGVIVRDED